MSALTVFGGRPASVTVVIVEEKEDWRRRKGAPLRFDRLRMMSQGWA
jgi:hypothetical protein